MEMNCKALTFLLSVRDEQCPNQDPNTIMVHIKDVLKRKLQVDQFLETPMNNGLISVLMAHNHSDASEITIFVRRYVSQRIHTINFEAVLHDNVSSNGKFEDALLRN